jgi:threonine/homoserine/homoserine lactone efflux protein
MDPHLVLRGLLLGLAIAAPVGPIGVLCIRRTLAEGRLTGFVTGLGAATADTFYGSVAAFGLAAVSTLLLTQRRWIALVGGLFLLYLGTRAFFAPPPAERPPREVARRGLTGAYLSTVALTLTNPATILSFVALFAGLGLASVRNAPMAATALVLGVFMGSALWWLVLSSGVSVLRTRLQPSRLQWISRASGTILLGFGVLALASVVR